MKLFDDLLAAGEELGAIRRDLHRHPELCFNELRTSELIAPVLTLPVTLVWLPLAS